MPEGVGWGTHAGVAMAASVVPVLVTNPLDVLKTRRQSRRRDVLKVKAAALIAKEGWRGAQVGAALTMCGYTISPTIKLCTYHALDAAGVRSPGVRGFLSGITTALVTSPLWVVKVRTQLSPHRTAWQVLSDTWGEGFKGFFRGVVPAVCSKSIEFCVFFAIYEKLKSLDRYTKDAPSILSAAAASRFMASIVAYPVSVITTRCREPSSWGGSRSLVPVAREVIANGTCFAGMSPHLMRVVPFTSLYFLCYETLLTYAREWQAGAAHLHAA